VLVTGDGSFHLTVQEISQFGPLGLKPVIFVLNKQEPGTIIGTSSILGIGLYDLEFGYYHWHYRPFNSLSRADFVNLLRAERFDRLGQSSEQESQSTVK
jgi:TPP-dependent 2-oxoacid decarboxylase